MKVASLMLSLVLAVGCGETMDQDPVQESPRPTDLDAEPTPSDAASMPTPDAPPAPDAAHPDAAHPDAAHPDAAPPDACLTGP